MSVILQKGLQNLTGSTITEVQKDSEPDRIRILFSNGASLAATYWRGIKNGRAFLSNFDDQQEYGLPAPINALNALKSEVAGLKVVRCSLTQETGDLDFELSKDLKLQIFNFTGYEVWEISFPDGTGEYSNYALG